MGTDIVISYSNMTLTFILIEHITSGYTVKHLYLAVT